MHGIKEVRCGSLQHFLKRETKEDTVTSSVVGGINGFVIDDVFHIDGAEDSETTTGPLGYKMILVERKRGEFCEIFVDEGDFGVVRSFEPSYFVRVDAQVVLVSRDPINGTCGCFNEGYWTFDKGGPIFLDVWNVIEAAEKNLAPPGLSRALHGEGFDFRTLTYSWGYYQSMTGGGAGGFLHLTFALKDHKLVLVSHRFDEAGDSEQATALWQAPTEAKNVKNPVKLTPDILKATAQLYQRFCENCHGESGPSNDREAKELSPKPANSADVDMMKKVSDGELFWKITEGHGLMPSFLLLTETQRWLLVDYLRDLSSRGQYRYLGNENPKR